MTTKMYTLQDVINNLRSMQAKVQRDCDAGEDALQMIDHTIDDLIGDLNGHLVEPRCEEQYDTVWNKAQTGVK